MPGNLHELVDRQAQAKKTRGGKPRSPHEMKELIIGLLDEKGLPKDVNEVDETGNTPIDVAVGNDDYVAIRLMLLHEFSNFKKRTGSWWTLGHAVLDGNVDKTRFLLEQGASIEEEVNLPGVLSSFPTLHLAVIGSSPSCMAL